METFILRAPTGVGPTITIDGVTYRIVPSDANGNLMVAIGAPFTPTNVGSGQYAVPNAPVVWPIATQVCRAVSLEALAANTVPIYIGRIAVTTATGRELAPGAAIDIAIENLHWLYAVAAIGGQKLSYLWVA
jgi:hypothetical protein